MRAPDPRVVEAVRRCLTSEPVTGAVIARHLRELGLPCHLRRVGEAISWLIEVERVPVAASSRGYWLGTADDLRRSMRDLDLHARSTFLRRRALRVALAEMQSGPEAQLCLAMEVTQ